MDDLTRQADSLAIVEEVQDASVAVAEVAVVTPAVPVIDMPQGQLTQQIGHHLSSLSKLITSLTAKAETTDDAQKEAEMWKVNFLRATRELESAKSEAELQRDRAEKVEARTRENAGPPFSAVLIDGDGLIFHEALLRQGRAGGQKAAQTLLSSLPEVATRLPNVSSEPRKLGQIVIMIFVNKTGLAGALLKSGVIPSFGALDSFFAGFSASHDSFSVIDVGQGKEASDAKIREYLKLYAYNAQCAMILLGATHDNGYATVLSSGLKTEQRLNNLLLLKGYTSLAYDIKQLNLTDRVVSLPDLFRSDKVANAGNGKGDKHDVPAAWRSSTSGVASEAPARGDKGGLIWPDGPEPSSFKGSAKETIITKDSTDDDEDDAPEYFRNKAERKRAGVNKAPGPKYKTLVKKQKDKNSVRNMNPRPCHAHYLSVEGCKQANCPHGHSHDLTDAQIMELATYAKQVVCPYVRGHRCRFSAEDCVYGHFCPFGRSCPFGATCRFASIPDAHPEDETYNANTEVEIPDDRSIYTASMNMGWA